MATTADQIAAKRFTLTGLLDLASASHARAAAMLVIVSLLAFLPGYFQIPPVDRDEARFAQATRQMIETGDYLDIRFQNTPRYKKPIGVHWLQAAAVKAGEAVGIPEARMTIWLYRMPSLLGAVGAVLLTYWTALAFVSRRASVIAAAMMATSVLLAVEARLAKTDAVLLCTIVAAMGALARAYFMARRTPDKRVPFHIAAIFWSALAVGVLVKGPVSILVVGLTVLTLCLLDRSWRWLLGLRPIAGMVWFAAVAAPWFVVIIMRAGDAFLTEALLTEILARMVRGAEGHGAPPGYYLLLFWLTFWPGAVVAGAAAPTVWRARREPGAQFLLAWLVPSWLFFEIIVTKLPHYVLPLYPAVAILIAGIVERGALVRVPWMQLGLVGWLIVPVAMSVVGVVGFIALAGGLGLAAWPFAAAAIVMGLFAWRLFELDGAERSLLRAFAASVLLATTIFGLMVPSLPSLFPSPALAAAIRSTDCPRPPVAAVGYHEPSLVFLLGTQTRLTDAAGAVEFLREGGCRAAIVERRQERAFVQHAEAVGLRYSQVTRVEAFNFSGGRAVNLAIFLAAAE
jgi:4-amino-4-deoxy-L-arabinose transferase-like glycosyltransferase